MEGRGRDSGSSRTQTGTSSTSPFAELAKISLVAVEDYARACAIAHRQPPAGLDTARFADVYSAYEQEKTSHMSAQTLLS